MAFEGGEGVCDSFVVVPSIFMYITPSPLFDLCSNSGG